MRDRESVFLDYISELAMREKREKAALIKEKATSDVTRKTVRGEMLHPSSIKKETSESWEHQREATSDVTRKAVRGEMLHPSSIKKEKFESWEYQRDADIQSFTEFLAEEATSDVTRKAVRGEMLHPSSIKKEKFESWEHQREATSDVTRKAVRGEMLHPSSIKKEKFESWEHQREATSDVTRKAVRGEMLHPSSIKKEKFESWEDQRDADIQSFKAFLAEEVKHTEIPFGRFRSRFYDDPRWQVAIPTVEKQELYERHVNELRNKNRTLLYSILDGMKISIQAFWHTVRWKIEADPRIIYYTDNSTIEEDFRMYQHNRFLKATEDFLEMLRENKFITPETKLQLQQGTITYSDIKRTMQKDERYTILMCNNKARDRMIFSYINELAGHMQPPPFVPSSSRLM
ncbi:hypothetical protein BsWGS_05237 [Bradybaena similaris]